MIDRPSSPPAASSSGSWPRALMSSRPADSAPSSACPRRSAQRAPEAADVIADPASALNVFDFEEAAHRKVPARPLGVHGQRRRRRRDAAGKPRDLQTRAATAAPAARRHARRHACRAVRHRLQQPDFPLSDGRRAVVSCGRRIGGGPRRRRARHAAVPLHDDLDANRRGQQGARPAGLVSALRAEQMGGVRAVAATRRSGRHHSRAVDGGQHHRPQQRNLPAHAAEGSAASACRVTDPASHRAGSTRARCSRGST